MRIGTVYYNSGSGCHGDWFVDNCAMYGWDLNSVGKWATNLADLPSIDIWSLSVPVIADND